MLSLQEHQELGSDLLEMYNKIRKTSTLLGKKYPKTSPQAKKAEQVCKYLLQLRSIMDPVAAKDHPLKDTETINSLYFPPKKK
jgi:hypothetical protein